MTEKRAKDIGNPEASITGEYAVTVRGAKQWIAKLTGAHPQFRFERQFCISDLGATRRRGNVRRFYLEGPGVYEFRNFGGKWSGFIKVHDDHMVEEITANEAMCELVDPVTRLAMIDLENFEGPPPPSWV